MSRFSLLAALLTLLAAPVLAQNAVPPPVPDVKPPVMEPLDDSLEPQVTIVRMPNSLQSPIAVVPMPLVRWLSPRLTRHLG